MGSIERRLDQLEAELRAAQKKHLDHTIDPGREAAFTALFFRHENAKRELHGLPPREPTEEEQAALEVEYEPVKPAWVSEDDWKERQRRFDDLFAELKEIREEQEEQEGYAQ